MKTFRKIACAALVAAALFVAPTQTKANGNHGDRDEHRRDRDGYRGDGSSHWSNPPTTTPSGSVPVNGGLVVLLVAGLGLGIKILKDKTNRQTVNSIL